jgi:lysophospholipase L1-like esterase
MSRHACAAGLGLTLALLLVGGCGSGSGGDDGDGGAQHDGTAHGDGLPGDGGPPGDTGPTGDGGGDDGPPAPAKPRFVGRFESSDGGPIFALSGSMVETRFTGSGLTMRLDDSSDPSASNRYTVVVDQGTPTVIPANTSTQQYVLAQGLGADDHVVVVWKNTEWFEGDAQLLGIDLAAGGAFLPTPAPARRLEFVGDSITCGYGDLGADQNCPFTPATESHYLTYAGLTARALGADQITVCQSGIGMYRDNGGDTNNTMAALYPLSHAYGPTWDFGLYVPHAVVINLGTNDFAQGTPDEAAFKNAYRTFLTYVRGKYATATIILAAGPMLGGSELTTLRTWLDALVTERAGAGDSRFAVVEFATQDGTLGYGCDWHPSAAEHDAMADVLIPALQSRLGW